MINYKLNSLNDFKSSKNESYRSLCDLFEVLSQIDYVDGNAFLKQYLTVGQPELEELDKLSQSLDKLSLIQGKLKATIDYALHTKRNKRQTSHTLSTYNLKEAAEKLKMSSKTLTRRIKDESITCGYVNPDKRKRPIFTEDQIIDFLKQNKKGQY